MVHPVSFALYCLGVVFSSTSIADPMPCKKKPIVFINQNTPWHFEVAFSLIHWLSGKPLQYHSAPHGELQSVLERAQRCGSDLWIGPRKNVRKDRGSILQERMEQYNVHVGRPQVFDLQVFVTVTLHVNKTWEEFKNMKKTLLITHVCHPKFDDWENVWALHPNCPRFMLPTFFPFPARSHKSTEKHMCVLGSFTPGKRDYALLARLFEATQDCNFTVHLSGRGELPDVLKPWKGRAQVLHLLDVEYHLHVSHCGFVLPLLSNETNPLYFTKQLSSSVSYAIGFGVPLIAHSQVKSSYPMSKGEFYEHEQQFFDIVRSKQCGTM